MTDHLQQAKYDVNGDPTDAERAIVHALIAIGEEFRRFNDRAGRVGRVESVADALPLEVESLSHPSCRSAEWFDSYGDRWRYELGAWECALSGSWSRSEPYSAFGPYRRVRS